MGVLTRPRAGLYSRVTLWHSRHERRRAWHFEVVAWSQLRVVVTWTLEHTCGGEYRLPAGKTTWYKYIQVPQREKEIESFSLKYWNTFYQPATPSDRRERTCATVVGVGVPNENSTELCYGHPAYRPRIFHHPLSIKHSFSRPSGKLCSTNSSPPVFALGVVVTGTGGIRSVSRSHAEGCRQRQ